MDPIKEAFNKVKEEIFLLKEEISKLNQKFNFLNSKLEELQFSNKNAADLTNTADETAHFTALPNEIKGLKIRNLDFSTGNKGVPTDKPTDRQTNQQTDTFRFQNSFPLNKPSLNQTQITKNNSIDELKKAQDLLDSLDNIKKEIRLKFKSLTNREMMLFSTIYSLEEQGVEEINYRLLAQHLNLTESSIRDYTNKLISKNLPLIKIKHNNKQIFLKIPEDFKKIVSLSTLHKLREL
ncbi:MAG: hypothetical protein QW103_00380 [Candidatus Pacearchaeota archaeon]